MRVLHLILALIVVLLVVGAMPAPARADELAESVRTALDAGLDRLESDGDHAAASARLDALFDRVIAGAGNRQKTLFTEVARARRLVDLLGAAGGEGPERLRWLRDHPDVSRALAFLVDRRYEKAGPILELLDRLRAARGEHLERYAALTAAICVVHDQPLARRINENRAAAPDPIAIFDFFVANERRMLFPPRDVPAQLLVYVVDTTATVPEMAWALDRYAGDVNVGSKFFDIEYDHAHLRTGAPKRVTVAGWNLPNILRYGGVCADQAYFAVSVGKSIGVPTAYTVGASSQVSHAWVGFLQTDGSSAWWNFDTGRYDAYKGVRGNVRDPQIRRTIPDSSISLLADFVRAPRADREAAAAFTDAAARLLELERSGTPLSGDPETPPGRRPVTADQLALLELGLADCPGYAGGWYFVRELASDGRLTLKQKKRWAQVLDRLCGRRYPDFSLAILGPMIATVDDPDEQNRFWNAAFRGFEHRPDLAASVRMAQAELWRERGRVERAGQCYEDVISRYANAGPFVLDALAGAEEILRESGDARRLILLYDKAWSGTTRPKDMAGVFFRQSNWFRVGARYADRLEEAGLSGDAARVRRTIGL